MIEQELFADLNKAQREAVTHVDGPLLILAAAGSGKTRVITRRVAHLLHLGVRPGNVLAITFTNKAAGEMQKRVAELMPGNRVWISTFHAFGARLLRQYADRLGLERTFTIYDQTDRAKVVKLAIEDVNLEELARFSPESLMGIISKAKNQLLSPERFGGHARTPPEVAAARAYPYYEKRLRESNALDFDDLLYWPALALKHDQELRKELDARFQYVMIDEYQDTNQAQYEIARRLSVDHPNLCVVGDPDQCVPPGTLVQTPQGPRPIESIQDGERVLSATGYGGCAAMWTDKVMRNPYKGKLVRLHLEGGQVVRATPNHLCFAQLVATQDTHFVYLMYKRGKGYRLGTTRGVRTSKDGVIKSGLQVRTNQEVADAAWIVRMCSSSAEARFHEHRYSVLYGIPTMVFYVRGREMSIEQEWIDRLFEEVDTESAARRLMADSCLDVRYPHHRPGGVTRGTWGRRHVLFTLFGDGRKSERVPWHHHRVQMVTTGDEDRRKAAVQFTVRDGQKGTWRIETSRKHHADAMGLAQDVGKFHDSEVICRARLTPRTTFAFTPAGHIHRGMIVPVLAEGRVVERRVERVEWEDYEGPVFDLSVPETHNFVADGLVVHNSIYKFRGSDVRNILDFERDFPQAKVMTLSLNYRSTKNILAAADALIGHNVQRKPKDLLTDNPAGQKVTVLVYRTGSAEADDVARRIRRAVADGGRKFRDFAILVRMNALTRALESACIQQRVPYQIVKGLAFFERKENRDVLAYLRLLVNPRDDVSFERVVNEPPRGVGETTLKHLRAYASSHEIGLLAAAGRAEFVAAIKGKGMNALRNFHALMQELAELREAAPDEVIRAVLEKSGYRQALLDSRDEEDAQRLANVEELITAAHQFGQDDPSRTVADFLENITLSSDLDGWDADQDCVSVMTMHAAKGLEFPVVYIVAVEQGLIPHVRALESRKDEEVEEERRLAFVGMTRAQKELYLTRAREREFRGQTNPAVESMFLRELPEGAVVVEGDGQTPQDRYRVGDTGSAREAWAAAGIELPLPKIQPKGRGDDPYPIGSLVRHASYGVGRVTKIDGYGATRSVTIRFPAGEHKFRISHVKLEMIRPA